MNRPLIEHSKPERGVRVEVTCTYHAVEDMKHKSRSVPNLPQVVVVVANMKRPHMGVQVQEGSPHAAPPFPLPATAYAALAMPPLPSAKEALPSPAPNLLPSC